VLDELGLGRQAALELRLKAALHWRMLLFVKAEEQNQDQGQRRRTGVSDPHELMRGKLSTLSVARLLLDADLLGAEAEVTLRKARGHAAA
jgi:hypothetical protein